MPKVHDLAPILASTDVAATVRFLVGTLGFVEDWTAEADRVAVYASLTLDGKGLFVVLNPRARNDAQVTFWIDDADAYHVQIVAKGATPPPPEDRQFGMRDFDVRAPGGVILTFGSQIAR